MSEVQAFKSFPLFQEGFVLSQYDAMVGMTPSTEGGIACWPKAVKYFLTNYAKARDNTKAVQDLWDTNRKPK